MLPEKADCAVLSDGYWEEVILAAEVAGRLAVRELTCRCAAGELTRGGIVEMNVGPSGSPLAAWLWCSRRAVHSSDDTASIEVALDDTGIPPASSAGCKASSLLVRQAYASAYCTVLAEEAGAVAERHVTLDPPTLPRQRTSSPEMPARVSGSGHLARERTPA